MAFFSNMYFLQRGDASLLLIFNIIISYMFHKNFIEFDQVNQKTERYKDITTIYFMQGIIAQESIYSYSIMKERAT